MAPCVFLVAIPGVKKFRPNLRGELLFVHSRLQVRGWQGGNDQKKYYSSIHFRNLLLPESDRLLDEDASLTRWEWNASLSFGAIGVKQARRQTWLKRLALVRHTI